MSGPANTSTGQKLGSSPKFSEQKDKDDHTHLLAEKFRRTQAQNNPNPPEMSDITDDLPDYIDTISKVADENFFEPYFRSNATLFEKNLSDNMTDLRSIRKIDLLLRHTKVFAALGSIFLLSLSLRSGMRASPIYAVIYGVLSADCLRMSYNCYIKNYCAIAMKKLGSDGNPAKIGAAVFKW